MGEHQPPRPRRQRRVPGGSPRRINIRATTAVYDALAERADAAELTLPRYLVESGLADPDAAGSLRQRRWLTERLVMLEAQMAQIRASLAERPRAPGDPDVGLADTLDRLADALEQHARLLAAIDPAGAARAPLSS